MIDWDRVAELKEEVGADEFEEVVEIFLEEVEEKIEEMRDPTKGELEADLHFLKGSALNLGLDAFSKLCRDGELAAAQGKADTVDLPQVFDCYASSKAALLGAL